MSAVWHMADSHCCNSNTLQCRIDLDSGTENYQMGKTKSPADTKWMTECYLCAKAVCSSVFLIASGAYIWSIYGIFMVSPRRICFCQWTKWW